MGTDRHVQHAHDSVYVGSGTDIKFTVADFNSFTSETSWHEDVSFSLFGLIKLGSEDSSGGTTQSKVTSLTNGFQLTDTSGVPKIIALSVEPINYP